MNPLQVSDARPSELAKKFISLSVPYEGDLMQTNGAVIVLGQGEIGRPLREILSRSYECIGVDIEPVDVGRPCSVMHVCYPYQIKDFVSTTVSYVEKYQPSLTIINSTVPTGTTRQIQGRVGLPVTYSPVRGKHARMHEDMLRYKKFVAGFCPDDAELALRHFAKAGFKTDTFRTPEIAELSKLLETTWLGVLVGWSQEVERLAAQIGGSYEEVNSFLREIDFLPSHIFPGVIGGHCVMPNISILRESFDSTYLDAVVESNQAKQARDAVAQEIGQ
jgi:UDP-N-acetyl-D-mannosaminuronate dehydrogenase